jgi:ADP-ribose pyrophosphatase YjhB (NUDIX family)
VFIKKELYSEIIQSIPIVCVDAIIKKDDQYLLVKRTESPLKDEWWVPGGRVNIGEKLDEALKRKVNEELSISIDLPYALKGIYEDFFDSSSLGEHLYHTISFVYEFNISRLDIELDKTSSEWCMSINLPDRLLNKMRSING